MCRLGLEHWAGRRHISGCRSAPGIWHSSSMKSGLLLLPVLLALWAELSPASGQLRQAGDVCQLPAKPGPCEAYMPHYFYNPASKSCERFIYGGCGGNGNRFATEEECLRACGQTEICKLPKEPGPCLAYMPRYFYDPVTKSCQMFIYGGCQGNGNRFATKEECLRTCGRSAGDVCQLPAKPGPCEAYMPHYFYNPASKSCERFIYGGCGGNGNRFATEEECLRACGQTGEPVGVPWTESGQRHNMNGAGKAGDVCQLPANPGPCEAYMPHYFYNPASKSCKRFIYGGCGGNGNRFATEEECLRACGQTGPPFPQGQPEMD